MVTPSVTSPSKSATATRAHAVDWEAMEPDWRAGVKSKQQLSQEYGVSRAAIDKHWAKAGVERDLTARIQAKADALVTQHSIANVVTPAKLIDREIVAANGNLQATVRLGHRKDIDKARTLAMKLLAELEAQTTEIKFMRELGEIMRKPDEAGADRVNDLYQKVISLPTRSQTMKTIGDTLKTLVALEREAYSINTLPDESAPTGIAAFLAGAGMKRSALPVKHEVDADDDL